MIFKDAKICILSHRYNVIHLSGTNKSMKTCFSSFIFQPDLRNCVQPKILKCNHVVSHEVNKNVTFLAILRFEFSAIAFSKAKVKT
jgi:hypothetical protein